MKFMVFKELGAQDSKPYLVATFDSTDLKRLVILGWWEKEDEARASAHRLEFGE